MFSGGRGLSWALVPLQSAQHRRLPTPGELARRQGKAEGQTLLSVASRSPEGDCPDCPLDFPGLRGEVQVAQARGTGGGVGCCEWTMMTVACSRCCFLNTHSYNQPSEANSEHLLSLPPPNCKSALRLQRLKNGEGEAPESWSPPTTLATPSKWDLPPGKPLYWFGGLWRGLFWNQPLPPRQAGRRLKGLVMLHLLDGHPRPRTQGRKGQHRASC